MPGLAALQYAADGFDTRVGKLMGRQMAGKTFLRAWIEHAGADPLTSWTSGAKDAEDFLAHARELGWQGAIASAQPVELGPLLDAGALWLADPSLDTYAWQRRWRRQDGYSIVGITHTMSSHAAMERVTALLTAPVQPWDALICTSAAIKAMVTQLLDAEADYLAERLGARTFVGPELPVIPLGVACADLAFDASARARWRARLGLGGDDVAVLQFGRIASHAKAHPAPLYLALAQAGAALGRPLHLILAGRFINEPQEASVRALAAAFADRVRTHFVDGLDPDVAGVRAAADVGTLLSDNIQETFGLAPVELMAAGLPVVASDWDGLRDTIEHGVTGFRIDTLVPPPGAGEALARRYDTIEPVDHFTGGTAQSTAIDLAQAAEAFHALAADPALRRRMGDAAAARARQRFDWPVVIAAYRDLLADLAARRRGAGGERVRRRPRQSARAARLDPFIAFAAHATARLAPEMRLAPAPGAAATVADVAGGAGMSLMHPAVLAPAATIDAMLAHIRAAGPLTIADLAAAFPAIEGERLYRTAGWLLKFGYVVRER